MTQAQIIINQARTWLGTAFQHQGRIKASHNHKGGCDCIGLLIGVAAELSLKSRQLAPSGEHLLLSRFDQSNYPRLLNNKVLQEALERHCYLVLPREINPADIILLDFGHGLAHIGIVSACEEKEFTIIHAYIKARKVIEHRLEVHLQERIIAVFRLEELVK